MPHQVTVNVAQTHLPNGSTYGVGATVILTDSQFGELGPNVFTDGTLTDGGNVGPAGDVVTTQAADVANLAAVTSAQNATTNASDLATAITLVNALKINYNALQVDVVANRAGLNALLTALRGAAKPMI
jgi:hypothetical protein